MLCDACSKISHSLEPIRAGVLNHKSPWPDLIKDLTHQENPSPYDRLLMASLAEKDTNQEIPNSQILVPTELDLELQPSLNSLRESSDLGCEGCSFWLRFVPEGIHDRESVIVRIQALEKRWFGEIQAADLSMLRLVFVGAKLESGSSENQEIAEFASRSFEVCTAEDDPAAADERILFRTIATDFDQPHSWTSIKAWLTECVSSHDECRVDQDTFVPTRVLDVNPNSDPDHIQLHVTDASFRDPYIALSYCWGKDGFFKTTSKNIDALRDNIDLKDMPVVVQDAVKSARELNVRYLWIDALCIIQDSTEDWASESLKMGEIYQNAFLTIAASSSSGVTGSFLGNRPAEVSLKVPFQSTKISSPGFIYLRDVGDDSVLRNAANRSKDHWKQPIHQRAWTLQERFMSTRVVFFDPKELLFECRCTRRFEGCTLDVNLEGPDYPSQLASGRRGNDNFAGNLSKSRLGNAWTRETVYLPSPLMYADKYAQVEFNEHWHRLLIDFGLRNLTYSSDALFALSAIAKKFGADLDDCYMAGIWANDFRKGLLWNMRWYQMSTSPTVAPHLKSILEELPEHQRDFVTSGPTWSWLARFTQPDKINFSVVASQKPLHDE